MHTPLSHLGAWFVALALLLTACAPASSLSSLLSRSLSPSPSSPRRMWTRLWPG